MTEEVQDEAAVPGPSPKRLTDEEFAAAKELYELGKSKIFELAAEFGVSRQALSRRFKDHGVIGGSRAHELNQATAVAQKAIVERFAERRAELIEETRMSGITALKQARLIAQKIIVDQMRATLPLGQVDDDLKAIGRLNKILVDNITTSLAILQADEHIDEADLPILTIEDLTDNDILEHHKSTGALDADATFADLNLEIDE